MSRCLVKAPRISRIVKGHILWIRNEDAEPKCLPCKSLSVESFVTNSHRLRGLHRWFHDVNLRRACVPLPKVNGACTVQLATSPVHGGVSRLPVDLHNCRPWFCTVNTRKVIINKSLITIGLVANISSKVQYQYMVFSRVFRQLLELQSKIEHWKLPRCIFGVSPGDVAQAGLRGAAKHLSEHPNVTPRNAKKNAEAETNSIDLVVLEFQVVHKDQSMAHFPAKVAGENLMHKKVLARWNFRVLRHTGKTFSSSPTTRTFTSTQWTREKASQVLVNCIGLLIVNQICLAKSYLFINLNEQWFQYIPMMYLKKVNPKKSKFATNPWPWQRSTCTSEFSSTRCHQKERLDPSGKSAIWGLFETQK